MMDNDSELLRQTYQLAKENNRMLHAMRRSAFLGGLMKLVFYAAILYCSYWAYVNYLAPVLSQLIKTATQIQGAGNNAQQQALELQKTLQDLQSKIPGLSK